MTLDSFCGYLQRSAEDGVDAVQSGGYLDRIYLDGRRFSAVESGRQLAYGLVTTGLNVVENGPYGTQDSTFGARSTQVGSGQGGPQIRGRAG